MDTITAHAWDCDSYFKVLIRFLKQEIEEIIQKKRAQGDIWWERLFQTVDVQKLEYSSHDIAMFSVVQGEIGFMGHNDIIKQGAADINILVICLCSQLITLRDNKKKEEIELNHAFKVEDGVLLCHKVFQHLLGL